MKKTVRFRGFDGRGHCGGGVDSRGKYAVREAAAHLGENGLRPPAVSDRGLACCRTDGRGADACVL